MNKIVVCGRCGAFLKEKDKYCRECGSKRNEKKYVPEDNELQCIYGPPPMERKHICNNCGFTWNNYEMIDRERYCPKCGSIVEVTGDE